MESSNSPIPVSVSSDVDVNVPSSSGPVTLSTPAILKTPSASTVVQKRRSSTRSIKRKKFDDELVESSLAKTDRSRSRVTATASLPNVACSIPTASSVPAVSATPSTVAISDTKPVLPSDTVVAPSGIAVPALTIATTVHAVASAQSAAAPTATSTVSSTDVIPSTALMSATPTEKKKSKSSSKRSKKSKTCDLTAVFHGVKFSCKFTLKEIQERWYALMYDSVLSKLAIQAMKQLHPDVIAEINTKALYSKHEEDLLKRITSNSQPTVDVFQECLSQNHSVFHSGRTAKSLHNHWLLLKQYHLLPDQSVPPMPKGDHVLNFSDAEDMINEEELRFVDIYIYIYIYIYAKKRNDLISV
ncbi:hypothetical protein LSH36_430g00060 [Paralvinella palmiformis]|uniref:Microspherule protein N-terminal domain-containing protein n=1 Tax=Paralvinella palmiformis TaxID=53620 RepID=A0AAD9JCT0_9ANNE|nr:hypothetical protein LSH36_430g00060 [Paralvinella palmiformis]